MPLTQKRKAQILDQLFPLIMQNLRSDGILRYLRGDGYGEVQFWSDAADELIPALDQCLEALNDTDALFKEYLGESLRAELGAQSIKIKW